MSLKQAVREALKGNDVEVHAKLTALRSDLQSAIDEALTRSL